MGLSKERTKKYRERLKENEEKYEIVKKKDRKKEKRLFEEESNSA